MKRIFRLFLIAAIFIFAGQAVAQEHSVARQWNEILLNSIRRDFARPTVHARNLFHVSAAMYDAWAVYDGIAQPYLLGRRVHGYENEFEGLEALPTDLKSAREEAMSYAAYNLIIHRFTFSPGVQEIFTDANALMADLGYDISISSKNYNDDGPAALGNYIAQAYIDFGLQDGSNEAQDYINRFYEPVNPPIVPVEPGNELIIDLNRWQPMFFDEFIDQAGNSVPAGVINFLSPEWGGVSPFALQSSDRTIYERDGHDYWVFHDPGSPPQLESDGSGLSEEYKWGFSLVSVWGSHLDPADSVMIDISPGSIGNTEISSFPTSFENYEAFYDLIDGGDTGQGHDLNPVTGSAYEQNLVPRGDYARVLAEFWADGPDSETPPGHWFTILNYVLDHPLSNRKFNGQGDDLDELEYEIKAYFLLGGAMHDAAVSAWGIKGWYDYIRPISAIRAMADRGQSTNQNAANYHVNGIPLLDGFVETVQANDPLAGANDEHVGKIKLFTWRGHDFIEDPEIDVAGVGWILAENWWPYQRPTFVTPPFAGYVSGHSTYSRAAAEVMTLLTGDAFFPGGMGEFLAKKNQFLVFEEGPSRDITLQWATYRDASDQTSLSRIWGGIHPPADDIPGRFIGEQVGIDAFDYAVQFFNGSVPLSVADEIKAVANVYPNPILQGNQLHIELKDTAYNRFSIHSLSGKELIYKDLNYGSNRLRIGDLPGGLYVYRLTGAEKVSGKLVIR